MIAYDPFDATAATDPYPLYDALRDDEPMFFAPETQTFVLSRYDDVAWALTETEMLSSDAMRGVLLGYPTGTGTETLPRADAMGNLVSVDPPDHGVLRRIVNRGFTPRRMAEWHDRIEETVRGLLAGVEDKRSFDVVATVAAPLPVRVITELVGGDPEDADKFRSWADAMTSIMTGRARVTGPSPEQMVAMMQLADDLGRRIDERHDAPRDDLLTTLVRAQGDDVLAREEAVGFAALLLFAGTETSTNLIGNATAALVERPELLERVRAEPAHLAAVMEETLRWESPVQYVFRRARKPFTRHGVDVPADSILTLLLGSANRDPRRWGDDAAEFDSDRDTSGHVAFGFGPHFCLGAALARSETSSALTHLLPLLEGAKLADDGVDWVDSMQFRGRHRLELIR